jgi:acetyl-CoA carboxylase carboxyltransferase component
MAVPVSRDLDPSDRAADGTAEGWLRLRARVGGTASLTVRPVATIGGDRPTVTVTVDGDERAGALGERDGATIEAAARTALAERLPLVIELASSGADVAEGLPALHGWGRAGRAITACSGVVPVIAVVDGPAVSGPALLLGLADHVVMTSQAYAFVSGPHMVRQFTGVPIAAAALGGTGTHSRSTGVASLVVDDLAAARAAVGAILDHLPANNDELPPTIATDDPADRPTPEAGAVIPDSPTGSYDVRTIIRTIADDGEALELKASWAPNLVTAFGAIGGQPVGFVANQPSALAGTLDIPGSQKGARFVAFCDAFNIPLVTLVDTPGFYPGKDLEWRGMIRHGAQLAFAYARASVPRVNVTLRKSYGGAYIVMDSKRMGNDLALAWPAAEIAVMGAKGAVEILHRRAEPEERAELERTYEERLLNPYIAAERGFIDAVIDPADTRRELAAALQTLGDKRERLQTRIHDNTPL